MTTIIRAVAAVLFLCFAVTAMAENCVPMARKGEIPSPSVLADNIEVSLQADPSGNGRVEGANISPNGFLKAIQGAGGTVASVDFLPTYLKSLAQGPMPKRETYSRTCKDSADGEYYVDITKGFTREARLGEVGWYDTNTNYLILAGDCSNSPLRVVERKPEIVAYEPVSIQPYSPYANSCRFGDKDMRYLEMRVYEAEAALQSCAKEHMLPPGGILPHKEGPFGWGDESAFSVSCAEKFDKELYQWGQIKLSNITRAVRFIIIEPTFLDLPPVKISALTDDELNEMHWQLQEQKLKMTFDGRLYSEQWYLLFEGTLVGNKLTPASEKYAQMLSKNGTAVIIPDGYETGWVYVEFDDYSTLRTPAPSGIAWPIEKFSRGQCRAMQYVGIDAEPQHQAPAMSLTTSSKTEAVTN